MEDLNSIKGKFAQIKKSDIEHHQSKRHDQKLTRDDELKELHIKSREETLQHFDRNARNPDYRLSTSWFAEALRKIPLGTSGGEASSSGTSGSY